MGRGQVQGPQARTSRTQGHMYAIVLEAKRADHPDRQGIFLLLHMLFKLGCIILIVVASCVMELVLEVRAFGKAIIWENSPLGSRVRVGQICWDCESEISRILLMVDLRVVDISGFDVLDMDELTTHRVVSDYDLRQVIIPDTVLELCKVAYACE